MKHSSHFLVFGCYSFESLIKGFSCSCPEGTTGQYCEVITDACKLEPCKNGAICITKADGYECRCTSGFEGKNCELEIITTTSTSTTTQTTSSTSARTTVDSIESLFTGECQLRQVQKKIFRAKNYIK